MLPRSLLPILLALAVPATAAAEQRSLQLLPPRLTRIRYARGRLRFRLSEPADVRIVVRRGRPLRLAGRPAGPNRVRLRVRRGRHRATITAVDAAGNRSLPARVRFRAR